MIASLVFAALALAAPAASTVPNDPELEALLLTVDDMPTGWAVDTSGTFDNTSSEPPGDSNDPCSDAGSDALFGYGFDDMASAHVTFTGASFFDIIDQQLAQTPDGSDVGPVVETMSDLLADCPPTTDDEGNTTTFSEMSFPELGDSTIAMRATVTGGFPITAAVVVIGIDDKMIVLFAVGEGADGELLEDVARTAVDRVD